MKFHFEGNVKMRVAFEAENLNSTLWTKKLILSSNMIEKLCKNKNLSQFLKHINLKDININTCLVDLSVFSSSYVQFAIFETVVFILLLIEV